jgi:hypothetical protein
MIWCIDGLLETAAGTMGMSPSLWYTGRIAFALVCIEKALGLEIPSVLLPTS